MRFDNIRMLVDFQYFRYGCWKNMGEFSSNLYLFGDHNLLFSNDEYYLLHTLYICNNYFICLNN